MGILGIFDFIAEQRVDEIFDAIPFPKPAEWIVTSKTALLDWDKTVAYARLPHAKKYGGYTLVVVMPPPIEATIDYLYTQGWKRGGWFDHSWQLYAYVRRDGMEIRVRGTAEGRHPDKRITSHFYAPDPPPLSRHESFKAEFEEYMRKCREDEW